MLDIDSYSGAGEYREAAATEGIGVSTTFCFAVSSTMSKYGLTFARACRLLELKGYLIWAGKCPIVDLSGSKFWMPEDHEQEEGEQHDTEVCSQEEGGRQASVYDRNKAIRCVFFTFVVRNEALEEKYEGGAAAFQARHHCEYNDDITTEVAMSLEGLNDTGRDAENSCFVHMKDFVVFDASAGYYPCRCPHCGSVEKAEVLCTNCGKPLDLDLCSLGVPWLQGQYTGDGAMWVSVVHMKR